MDIVYLRDLRINAIIGAFEWERRARQVVSLDLDMAVNINKAATTDCLDNALDYKAVAKRVTAFVMDSRFALVETLAEQVTQLVLSEFNVPWIRLRVNKTGAVRGAGDVGVIVERGSKDFSPPER